MKIEKAHLNEKSDCRRNIKLKEISRILLYLRGFAIFFVIATHVAISLLAAEVAHGNPESLGAVVGGMWQLPSKWNFAILEIGRWPVPVFIFLAGYSLVRSPRSWKFIWSNCKKLIPPLIFWSLIGWLMSWKDGSNGWSITQFIRLFYSGRAQLGYYFILLILQFYIISKFLVPCVEHKPKLILTIAVFLQLVIHAYDYTYLLGSLEIIPSIPWIMDMGLFPEFLFPRFIISFTFGIWVSQNVNRFKKITEESFRLIIVITIIAIVFLMLEVGLIFHFSFNEIQLSMFEASSRAWGEWKISTAIWTIVSIFFLFSVFRRWQPFKKIFELFGKNSLQMFLLHGVVLRVLILFCYKILHNYSWYGFFSFSLLLSITILISIFSIKIIQKFPYKLRRVMLGD